MLQETVSGQKRKGRKRRERKKIERKKKRKQRKLKKKKRNPRKRQRRGKSLQISENQKERKRKLCIWMTLPVTSLLNEFVQFDSNVCCGLGNGKKILFRLGANVDNGSMDLHR